MTENQIERRVEKMIDRLDRQFMADVIGQQEYDTRMKAIRDWADAESAKAERARIVSNYLAHERRAE
jgi:hypothetical protein